MIFGKTKIQSNYKLQFEFIWREVFIRIIENELKNKTINPDKLLKYGFVQKMECIYMKLKYIMSNLK